MKRIIKSRIFAFILGAIIFGSIGVYASSYLAKDISFTPKNTNWKKEDGTDITNVKDAIDDLYKKIVNKDIKNILDNLGEGFGASGVNYNGFIVGHKYMAIYTSNFWEYGNDQYNAKIISGASDINIVGNVKTTSPRATYYYSFASIITFTATNTSISLSYGKDYGSNAGEYAMYFIDITN